MVAYYSFDASNATDDAGNGNNGTTNAVSYTDGKIGKAAQMNGNGYVLKNPISNFPSTEFTFSFWIKTIGTADAAISYAVPANNNELLLLNDR